MLRTRMIPQKILQRIPFKVLRILLNLQYKVHNLCIKENTWQPSSKCFLRSRWGNLSNQIWDQDLLPSTQEWSWHWKRWKTCTPNLSSAGVTSLVTSPVHGILLRTLLRRQPVQWRTQPRRQLAQQRTTHHQSGMRHKTTGTMIPPQMQLQMPLCLFSQPLLKACSAGVTSQMKSLLTGTQLRVMLQITMMKQSKALRILHQKHGIQQSSLPMRPRVNGLKKLSSNMTGKENGTELKTNLSNWIAQLGRN